MSEGRGWLYTGLAMAAAMVGGFGLFMWHEQEVVGHSGFPLDDSWIHLQMARNLSLGHGMYFNAGEVVSASSAPLWTLFLAALHLLPGEETVLAVKFSAIALLWGAGMVTAALGRCLGLSPVWAAGAGMALTLSPRMLWGGLSGMEIPLYTLLATFGIFLHMRSFGGKPSLASTALLALASLARPDCLVLFPLALLDRWCRSPSLVAVWRNYRAHVALFAVILAPAMVFNLSTIGRLLPNTYYAKVGDFGLVGALHHVNYVQVIKALVYYPLQQFQELIQLVASENLVLACLVPVGLLHMAAECLRGGDRSKRLGASSAMVLLVMIGYPLIRGVLAPFHGPLFQHGRYVGFLFPLFILAGVVGMRQAVLLLGALGDFPRARRITRWGPVLLWAILAINMVGLQLQYARIYAANVSDIEQMHVAMGRWLAENTGEDAAIATHDIGAIGYFSGRRIIDTSGLITPGVLPHLEPGRVADTGVLEFLNREKPEFLVVMPTWYPQLVQRKDHFDPIHEITLAERTIAAGDRLVVYRARWEGG